MAARISKAILSLYTLDTRSFLLSYDIVLSMSSLGELSGNLHWLLMRDESRGYEHEGDVRIALFNSIKLSTLVLSLCYTSSGMNK
jgi:hypothetical protein